MSVVDWGIKQEPWRSIGLRFVQDLKSDWVVRGTEIDRLRRAVYACGLSRTAIERKAALHHGDISHFLTECRGIPYNRREILARVLGVSPQSIWDGFKPTSE